MSTDASERRSELWGRVALGAIAAARLAFGIYVVRRLNGIPPIAPTGYDRLDLARSLSERWSFALDYGLWPAPALWPDGLLLKLWFAPFRVSFAIDSALAIVTLLLLHRIGKQCGLPRLLTLALCAFWAFQPATIWLSCSVQGESKAIPCVLAGVSAWLQFRADGRLRWVLASATAFMLASAARLDALAFSGVLTLLIAVELRHPQAARRRLRLGGCVAIAWAFAAAYAVYSWRAYGDPLAVPAEIRSLASRSWVATELPTWWARALVHPKALLDAWPVWMTLAPLGLVACVRKRRAIDLALFGLLPLLALIAAAAAGQMTTAFGPGPRHVLIHGVVLSLVIAKAAGPLAIRRRWLGPAALLAVGSTIPMSLANVFVPEIPSLRYADELGLAFDRLFEKRVLAPTDRILVLRCRRQGCLERHVDDQFLFDASSLLAHRNTLITHAEMPRPQLVELASQHLRVVVAHPEASLEPSDRKLLERVRDSMIKVADVRDLSIFALPNDVEVQQAILRARASAGRFTVDRAGLGEEVDGELRLAAKGPLRWPFRRASGDAAVTSAFYDERPQGDFLVSAAFDATRWPAPRADRNELGLEAKIGSHRYALVRREQPNDGCYAFGEIGSAVAASEKCGIGDRRGKIRLGRRDGQLCGAYLDRGQWNELGCRPVMQDQADLDLSVLSGSGDHVEARFTSFELTR